jgi:EAL domain-containing protein (putative c-di-GMP-specific phosphodiesterase class I)
MHLEALASEQPNKNWQATLRQAFSENRFELAFFPVYSLDWTLLHRETVIRLRHPETDELLPAGNFIPYVLRLGLAAELDLVAVKLALEEVRQHPQPLAINLSAVSIRSEKFREQLLAQLQAAGELAKLLWLEVNEFGLRDEMATLANFAAQVSRLGCKVGIEHFGRHFGSLPQLYELRLDYLKIDGSFIHNLDQQPGNQHLLRAIASIAHNLGVTTIAEQVNTAAEWEALGKLGIDAATGPEATRRHQG